MRAGEGDGKRMFWVEKNQKINYWGGGGGRLLGTQE